MKSDGTGSDANGHDATGPHVVPHPSQVTDVLLIRHGQTDWNLEGRMQGHEAIELNDVGREQVRATAEALKHLTPKVIVTSPILRAVQSAEIVGAALGYPAEAILLEPGFAEFDMGEWVGSTFMELWEQKVIQNYWHNPTDTVFPGGESMPAIQRRAVAALNAVVAEHGGGTIVVLTHGGIVRLLLLAAMELPRSHYFRIGASNASVARLQLSPGRPAKVHNINYTPGLPRLPWRE